MVRLNLRACTINSLYIRSSLINRTSGDARRLRPGVTGSVCTFSRERLILAFLPPHLNKAFRSLEDAL